MVFFPDSSSPLIPHIVETFPYIVVEPFPPFFVGAVEERNEKSGNGYENDYMDPTPPLVLDITDVHGSALYELNPVGDSHDKGYPAPVYASVP